jgi:hypothetical protein
MQFAIGVTVLEFSFVKHSHGPLGVKHGNGLGRDCGTQGRGLAHRIWEECEPFESGLMDDSY